MSKKLENNGLWESSRMMLPQHREAFVARQREQSNQNPPALHEDEFELIVRHIKESFYTQKSISVEWICEQKRTYAVGNVSKIDEHGQRIQLQNNEASTWIAFQSITLVKNVHAP